MEYQIHTETDDGVDVQSAVHANIIAAYDHCQDLLGPNPRARAVHIYVGPHRLHTVKRRDRSALTSAT